MTNGTYIVLNLQAVTMMAIFLHLICATALEPVADVKTTRAVESTDHTESRRFLQSGTYARTEGQCSSVGCQVVSTIADCNLAAAQLNLPSVTVTHTRNNRLPGCFFYTPTSKTEFNHNLQSTGDLSNTDALCYCPDGCRPSATFVDNSGTRFAGLGSFMVDSSTFVVGTKLADLRYFKMVGFNPFGQFIEDRYHAADDCDTNDISSMVTCWNQGTPGVGYGVENIALCHHDSGLPWYALVDGSRLGGAQRSEVLNPDPNQALGAVECCKENVCTRYNPSTSTSLDDCLSTYVTLREAHDRCAAIPNGPWTLCTREQVVTNDICRAKGCGIDHELVWVRDPVTLAPTRSPTLSPTPSPTTPPTTEPTTAPSPYPTAFLEFVYTDEDCIENTLDIGRVLNNSPWTIHLKLTSPECISETCFSAVDSPFGEIGLIDGSPAQGTSIPEVLNPDPSQALGEVQCCTSNSCTRRDPWNSGSNAHCISGNNDDLKFTFYEAMEACAALGNGWSLCTREQILDQELCKGMGCNHDSKPVWVLNPINPAECNSVFQGMDIVAGTFDSCCDHGAKVSSDAECHALCTADPLCNAWVTNSPEGKSTITCWLTKGDVNWETDSARNGGITCRGELAEYLVGDYVHVDGVAPNEEMACVVDVFSDGTIAVDYMDGSTSYEILNSGYIQGLREGNSDRCVTNSDMILPLEPLLQLGDESWSLMGNFFTSENGAFDGARFCETISATYDGTYSRIFCNGILSSITRTSAVIDIQDPFLRVGQGFSGCVTEVGVWDKVVSVSDIGTFSPEVQPGYCVHEKDPWNDDAIETIIVHTSEKDCWAICDEDFNFRACAHHHEPETCIAYSANNGNFAGSGHSGFKCYISKSGASVDMDDDVVFELFNGHIHEQTGERKCISRDDFSILRTISDTDHTIYMEFWLHHTKAPVNDEVIMNLGQESRGGQLWTWSTDRTLRIGTHGNQPLIIDEQNCRSQTPQSNVDDAILLTTVYENGVLSVYCDDNFMQSHQIDIDIVRPAFAVGELTSQDIGLDFFEDGCIIGAQIWNRALTPDEVADISKATVLRPSRTPSLSPTVSPSISLIQNFTHDCTDNQEQLYKLDRIMGVHDFTVHMQIDLRAESRHDIIGNSGYTLTMGPRDTTGSFYWDWDPQNDRNLIFGVVGSESISVSVWGCQHIATTYVESHIKIFCDNEERAELYVWSDLDITTTELFVGGHPFGRCITFVDVRSFELDALAQSVQYNVTSTTQKPSISPSQAPVLSLARLRIFDYSHHDPAGNFDCIASTRDLVIDTSAFLFGQRHTIHVQTMLLDVDTQFLSQTIFSMNNQIEYKWNRQINAIEIYSNNQLITSGSHQGLLCEHLTTSFVVQEDGLEDIEIYCESAFVNLSPSSHHISFNWVDLLVLKVGEYEKFCAKEVEMWERDLEMYEITELARFPELNITLGECSLQCGVGVQIRQATGCSSYHWGCDHLAGATSKPIECEIGVCQKLRTLTGYTLTNQAAVDSADCVMASDYCASDDGDVCKTEADVLCFQNIECAGFSISQGNEDDGISANPTYILYNDADCMAENTIYDFTTSIFMKKPTVCGSDKIALFLSTLRMLPVDALNQVTLGDYFPVNLKFGPFEEFQVEVMVSCPGEGFAMGIKFLDAAPTVGDVLELNALSYENEALTATVTLSFESQSMEFTGVISASEFSMTAQGGEFEIVSGIAVSSMELVLSPVIVRASGTFDFNGVEAYADLIWQDVDGSSVWSVTAVTSGTAVFGDVLEVEDLGIVFEKEGSVWALNAELGEARITVLDQVYSISGTIAYNSNLGNYRIDASIADGSPIKIYDFSMENIGVIFDNAANAALSCEALEDGSEAETSAEGFLASFTGTFGYTFEDSDDGQLYIDITLAYFDGDWLASGVFDSSNPLMLFSKTYLTEASVCTSKTDAKTELRLQGAVEWRYDANSIFGAKGWLTYDGKFFEAALELTDASFDLPEPFGSEIDFTNSIISYNGRDQEVSADLNLVYRGWTFWATLDVASEGNEYAFGIDGASIADFLSVFDDDIMNALPQKVEEFMQHTTISGSFAYSDTSGFSGDVTFDYDGTQLNFWFMYNNPQYAFLVQISGADHLGDASSSVNDFAGDASTNKFMIAYSNERLNADQGPQKLGDQEFENGLAVPDGASVQLYVDTRPPTDGSKDERVGIVKFIHDELKIQEIIVSLAVSRTGAETTFQVVLATEWSFWEFDIYQVDLTVQVKPGTLVVNLGIDAWCYLVEPAIQVQGDFSFGFVNGNFELGIGVGFTGTIYDAFGVDGLMLSDVQFEGKIATMQVFPFIQPKGLFLQGAACIDDETCVQALVYFSSSSPAAFYFAAKGEDWYLSDFIEWKMPKMKNKNLLNKIGFESFELEVGASLDGALSGNTQFKRMDGSAVRKLDGSVLKLDGPMFKIDIENFDFGIISGSRFLVDLTLGKNPKLRTEVDLDEINLGLFSIRDGRCRKSRGPRMKLEAWQGHFLLEAEGSVYKWNNCIGISAKVSKEEIKGCISIDLRVRIKYPSCKCRWKGWRLKCKCTTKSKLVGLHESLCASVPVMSGGRRALATDEDWIPDTSDMGAELWELREEIQRKQGTRIKVIHQSLSEFNGIYADETGETYMGFPVYRRLDNPDHIIHRFNIEADDPLDQPWVLSDTSIPSSDIPYIARANPRDVANTNIDQDFPWRVFWEDVEVRWMSNFGSAEISFRDRGVFKYQGEMRNGAPLYREISDPSMILFEGDDEGDEMLDMSNRWVLARQTEDSDGNEIITPESRSDFMQSENSGPWQTNWPDFENDFRHSLNSRTWDGTDLAEVPSSQWKSAIYIEGSNFDFGYDGEAWNQGDRYESSGSRIDPGYYKYPVQAIKISMNGVDRFFKLYLSDDEFRWPGFAGYTLKDLLTTDLAQNTEDGVFYLEEETNDLWGLFVGNETNATFPTPAPSTSSEWPSFGKYCVNDGNLPALDVNVNGDFEQVWGKILIRRGDESGCNSYEGIGLAHNVSAGLVDANGDHKIMRATVYVLPLPPACSTFCSSGHLVENAQGHWTCDEDVPGEIHCDCSTFLDGDVCTECPQNMWVGDSHHRITRCFPERCSEECDEGEHVALVSVSTACHSHAESTLVENSNDQCFARTDSEEELQCVQTSHETVCDCESFVSSEGTCVPCARGTWVGKSAHTLDETFCVPMRLGEVSDVQPVYSMAKGYVPEDRPNILEILEQTTHLELDDDDYIRDEIAINGARAQALFGDVDAIYDFTGIEGTFLQLSSVISVAYNDVIGSSDFAELDTDEQNNFDHFFAYYTKEKEVAYLSMQIDELVDKCIRHQMFCFVLNMVHREMIASQYQLSALKTFTDNVATGNLKLSTSGQIVEKIGIPAMLAEFGVTDSDLALYHKTKSELVTAKAYQLVRDTPFISDKIAEIQQSLTSAEDARVEVVNLTVPSSSFMDSERTEFYAIHGDFKFLTNHTFSFDMQKKVATTDEDAQDAMEVMMGDIRRDIVVQYIRDSWAKHRDVKCNEQPMHRYLANTFIALAPELKTEEFVNDNQAWSLSDMNVLYDTFACTNPPRLHADRYQSDWEVWHYQAEEYRYVARGNGEWDMSQQPVGGEMLLDESELEELKTINTVSEMSTGKYCTPEARSPTSLVPCCSGLMFNEESSLCETPCTKAGSNPWVEGTLVPCCVSDDVPMIEGSTYVCARPECASEGETYSQLLPCCEGFLESEVVLSSGESTKICVSPDGTEVMESTAPLFYRSTGCDEVIVEAERMGLSGGFEVKDDFLGYSFGGYITYDNDDSLAEFDVTSVSGSGVLQIRFYSLAHNEVDMEVLVNGVSHTVTFNHPNHGKWDNIYLNVEFYDDITATNRVQLKPIVQDAFAYPLIDRIVVQEACASIPQDTEYHFVGRGYCRADDCASGDCRVQGYYKQLSFDSSENMSSLPSIRLQRFLRESGMFLSSEAECKQQCDNNADCIGFSISDEDFEFPSRCIVHVTDLRNMPSSEWRPLDGSLEIEFSSNLEGVSCYSKIVDCEMPTTCNGPHAEQWLDCDGDGIDDPICQLDGGSSFEVQLSSKACKVSTTCEIIPTNDDPIQRYHQDNWCLQPYTVAYLESNIKAYCQDVEYTPERLNPVACDAADLFNVKLALANTMFKQCDDTCLYDVYDPAQKAFSWDDSQKCWQTISNVDNSGCFDSLAVQFAISRKSNFCEGTFECSAQAYDRTSYVENTDFAILDLGWEDCGTCLTQCRTGAGFGFECGAVECRLSDCIVYREDLHASAVPSTNSLVCSFEPYFPEIDNLDYTEIQINFQPSHINAPDGHLADSGDIFGLRTSGYTYGWDCNANGGSRDRNGLGTVDSTLIMLGGYAMDCSSNEWKIVLPNGRYNVELGFSDTENGIDTSGCVLQGVSADVGDLEPREKNSVLININVVDRLVSFSGRYMDGCDSVSYITIKSGWDLGFELGVENGNECNAGSLSIVDEEECIAAAEAMGLSFLNSYNMQSNPKGCHLLPGAGLYFNFHDVGMGHWGYTPVCKNIGYDYGVENGNACDSGAIPVVSETECLDAARAFGMSFERTENLPSNPKGCHWLSGVGFYFNAHVTGSSHWGYTPICRTISDATAGFEKQDDSPCRLDGSFTKTNEGCVSGQSLQECANRCRNDPTCISFDINTQCCTFTMASNNLANTGGAQCYNKVFDETLVFRQRLPELFTSGELRANANNPSASKYAILDDLENYRSNDGSFYFRLSWPDEEVSYEWSQLSNPTSESISGYQAISVPFTGNYWGGLEPSNNALIDGSVNHGNWFYAIGAFRVWNNGIPGNGQVGAVQAVELYVTKKGSSSRRVLQQLQTTNRATLKDRLLLQMDDA